MAGGGNVDKSMSGGEGGDVGEGGRGGGTGEDGKGGGQSILHTTRTYFWLHVLHFHSTVVERSEGHVCFRSLLMQCPFLAHPIFIHDYYSDQRLSSGEAARTMVLSDLKPLPSILPTVDNNWVKH